MQFKHLAAAAALFFGLSAALPSDGKYNGPLSLLDYEVESDMLTWKSFAVLTREPIEAYCCGLGRRGELVTKCCLSDVQKRDAAAVPDEEFSELYCCGLGRRGELNTKCCL